MEPRHVLPFVIEISQYPLGLLAIGLCAFLCIRTRQFGWLLLSSIFVAPFFYLIYGILRGLSFPLHYRKIIYDDSGLRHESISYNVPFFLILAVTGLLLIAREKRK